MRYRGISLEAGNLFGGCGLHVGPACMKGVNLRAHLCDVVFRLHELMESYCMAGDLPLS